jgi:hypothetical protein
MQGNATNIILVADKLKAIIGKLGLCVRKLDGKSLDMFSRLKHFVKENSVETSDTGIDQCIKDHLICCPAKYFPEVVIDKY